VAALLAEPHRIEEEYKRRLNIGNEAKDAPCQRKLQIQMSRVQRQISKLIDAYSDGLIEKGESEPRIRDARAHLEKLQVETRTQEQLQAQLLEMRQVIGRLEAFAEQVRDRLSTADWTVQRQLISTLVKRVEIDDEEVRVVYRVDCGPFELAPSGGPGQDCWRRRGPITPGLSAANSVEPLSKNCANSGVRAIFRERKRKAIYCLTLRWRWCQREMNSLPPA
jgi:site-specific DNA recombinase